MDGTVRRVWTNPLPALDVDKIEPGLKPPGVTLEMETLAEAAADPARLRGALEELPRQYGEAFGLMNRAIALSQRRRTAIIANTTPEKARTPAWRAFQLAFVLLNLDSLADRKHPNRKIVDLLVFPTGGSKSASSPAPPGSSAPSMSCVARPAGSATGPSRSACGSVAPPRRTPLAQGRATRARSTSGTRSSCSGRSRRRFPCDVAPNSIQRRLEFGG